MKIPEEEIITLVNNFSVPCGCMMESKSENESKS
jgi:hypothetical protein